MRKAKEALFSLTFCMLALLRAAICSLESQRRKKLSTSAISNAYKIYNSIQICNPNSWLAKTFVVTLATGNIDMGRLLSLCHLKSLK